MELSSVSKFGSQAQGWMLIIFGSISFLLFVYAAGFSKFLPDSGNPIIAAIQNDRYYCFLVPLTLPLLLVAVYFHWLSMKLFKHA
nr:Phosphatidylinositol N-acetylglucosaminyltransferase subunit Y [Ipomoea batatas]